MAKKRKAGRASQQAVPSRTERYDVEERFDDSEDDFFAGRDKILLDEAPAAKRLRRLEEREKHLQSSDEEVYEDAQAEVEDDLENDDDVDFDADAGDQQDGDEDEELDENWGTSKADYYNTDVIETEADALEEEAEARRLQQKQLKAMTEADFGFDESAWVDETQKTQGKRSAVEKLPELRIPPNATAEERTQILKSRYPEFEPLAHDFISLQDEYRELKKTIVPSEVHGGQNIECKISLTRFRALSSYLGAVAMYLAVLTSSKSGTALAPGDLREHPIMSNLVRCRQLWQEAQDLKAVEVIPVEEQVVSVSPHEVKLPEESKPKFESKKPEKSKKSKKTTTSEIRTEDVVPEPVASTKKTKKSKNPKRDDLQELLASSLQTPEDDESDFGDEVPLTAEEAAEKAKRKKSLRFYTSQIAQKANKRGAASRNAGGDDDVPHKERFRDKQDRLMREAEMRGRVAARGDEEVFDSGDDDTGVGQELNDDANEYYDMLVSGKKAKKADKQARAEAYAEAARQGAQVFEEEQVGADGKRKITYAIEKNKGLAPKRKKDVRNPRVKKRKKFDEKMKKLSSIRQVYKGGEGRGGYGGEATGIKTNVVKSIKL
ncbi:something about silencing protein 10 [Rhinocladiella similis]